MPVDVTIPSPGESISEVVLGPWHKRSGEWVDKDDTLVEIESDKVTLEVPAPESGVLSVLAEEGDERTVGDVIGRIDPGAEPTVTDDGGASATRDSAKSAPAPADGQGDGDGDGDGDTSPDAAANEVATAVAGAASDENGRSARATSLARKIADERGVDLASLRGSGPSGRIRKADVLAAPTGPARAAPTSGPREIVSDIGGERGVRREKMSRLRRRIAERLVAAQHAAAMLTTFNEVDMTAVMTLRKRYKDAFSEKYDVGLGFMSFFVKACVEALCAHPRVNAYIAGDEIEYHDYVDCSIAVGTDRGLVVPVVRDADRLSFAEVEKAIRDLAEKARKGDLTMDDMTGGTFTISNGGVYGSLNSTPILNPPQSGILGMHRIMNRPVEDPANPGQIALRPMMHLALSYDHRIVDGAEAVGFLVTVRDCLEDPQRMLIGL